MESDLKKDIIDGRIIDWSKLSAEELKRMKKAYEERENEIRMKIDKELDLYTEKMLIDNCFNKELEYEIDTGIFRVFTRPL